ncbi:hypothetical protein [Bernardetia sp.]|uniref:hypothetical protein n=1 Tax=Bernardetia sp. TaxID=1937974 RepID=UPI0025BF9D81|nr:hypothetical protein [Bernardetia sp.]
MSNIEERINKLSENLKNSQTFIDKLPVPACMVDENMNYVVINEAWCTTFPLHKKPLVGDNHYDCFDMVKEEYPHFVDEHKQCLEGCKPFKNKNAKFGNFTLDYILTPVFLANNRRGMIMIVDLIH